MWGALEFWHFESGGGRCDLKCGAVRACAGFENASISGVRSGGGFLCGLCVVLVSRGFLISLFGGDFLFGGYSWGALRMCVHRRWSA